MDLKHKVSVGMPLPRFPGLVVDVAVPCRDSLNAMYQYARSNGVDVRQIPLDIGRGLHIFRNHTNLANAMWGDWLLIVGSDHSFSPDALNLLLEAASDEDGNAVRPIISGVIAYRSEPHRIVGYKRDASGLNFMSLRPGIDFTETDCVGGFVKDYENGACGSGFCMYHRSVFDALPYPWFDPGVCMDDLVQYGPDLRICADAAKHGIGSSIHFGVDVMHWEVSPIHPGKSIDWINQSQGRWLAEMFHLTNDGINEDAVQQVIQLYKKFNAPEKVKSDANSKAKKRRSKKRVR